MTNQVLGERVAGVPPHVVLPYMRYHGSAYLGQQLEPLVVSGDPNEPSFAMPNLTAAPAGGRDLTPGWACSTSSIGCGATSTVPVSFATLDRFHQKAVAILTSDRVARAFDINQEDAANARPLRAERGRPAVPFGAAAD